MTKYLFATFLLIAGTAHAGDGHDHHGHGGHEGHVAPKPEDAPVNEAAKGWFTDVELVNQNGETMRLYSDLIKGRVVVISAFFATCQDTCPVTNKNMKEIQTAFTSYMGKELFLISLSLDPTTDTPAKLTEYAKGYEAKPGWWFLTGEPDNVTLALTKLGQYVEVKEAHKTILMVGNDRTGLWKKAFALGKADELVQIVGSVLHDKGE